MSRQIITIVLLAVSAWCGSACSGTGQPGSPPEVEMGTVSIPLTAPGKDVTYRLAAARFTLTDLSGSAPPLSIVATPDEHIHQELVPPGSYSVNLESGWQLESQANGSGDPFTPVSAVLISNNPVAVEVKRSAVVEALFRFATSGPVVDFGQGLLNIRIDVAECAGYDSLTSALGTYTVECLGTIGPDNYSVDEAGVLRRNFDSCPLDEGKLQSIDDYLSVQQRPKLLPHAQSCIAGRWAAWKAAFLQSGIKQCPDWTLRRLVNEPSVDGVKNLISDLGNFVNREQYVPLPAGVLQQLKRGALYEVGFGNGEEVPMQACGTSGDCAAQCAAGFAGFVTNAADNLVLTDPWDWDLDSLYVNQPNPFMVAGYFHPMSAVDPVPDGVIIGHRNRGTEACSRYVEPLNVVLHLVPNCLAPNVGCISTCGDPMLYQ